MLVFSFVSPPILPICQSSEESTTHVFRLDLSKLLLPALITPGGSNHTGISTDGYRMHIARRSKVPSSASSPSTTDCVKILADPTPVSAEIYVLCPLEHDLSKMLNLP